VVDLVGVRPEEAGARHDVRPHEGRRDERREPGGERPLESEVHEGDLEPGADALQEVEARAADFRATLHVDRVEQLAELEVVSRRELERRLLADLPQGDVVVLAPGGHPVEHDVLDAARGLRERLLRFARCGLGRLHLGGQLLGLLDEGGLLVLRSRGDRLAERVLLGAHSLERGDRRATCGVCCDRLVDEIDRLPAQRLRAPDDVGAVAQQLGIDHRSILWTGHPPKPPAAGGQPPGRGSRGCHSLRA
jgi:hypothetical protein